MQLRPQYLKRIISLPAPASAKLVTPHWVDYLTLSKLDGQWKILSVVQRIDN